MRIGINLLWLVPGVVGGSEEYLCRQLEGLAQLDHPHEVTVFALPSFAAAHPEVASRYPVVAAPVSGTRRSLRVAAENTWLAHRTRGLDLVHHGGGSVPARRAGVPAVLTIHDLQYLKYPSTFSAVKLAWLRHNVPRSVARAAAVVVPSEYVRGTVVEAFGVPVERVVVAAHGLVRPTDPTDGAASTSPATPSAPATPATKPTPEAELRERYGLTGRIVVYPAITYPHKNHIVLVRALAQLTSTHPDLQLVLLGGEGPAEASVREEVGRLKLERQVVRPGRVPAADRDGLYAMASLLAFPSRYEGFGAPVLEAMAAGLPVVAAAAAALPEVVDGAGLLVPPDDPGAWAEAIALVLDDAGEADLLRASGRARAARFTAARSAAALLHAYRLARP